MTPAIDTQPLSKEARLDLNAINDCLQLIKLGARPIVASAISGMSNDDAIRLYRMVTNHKAPRGLLPCDPTWIYDSYIQRNEAISFVTLHGEAEGNAPSASRASLMAATWNVHRSRFPSPKLDINRAWVILRFVAAGELILASCDDCGAMKLMRHLDPRTERCHVCSSFKGKGNQSKARAQ